jgi:hypothetical protein
VAWLLRRIKPDLRLRHSHDPARAGIIGHDAHHGIRDFKLEKKKMKTLMTILLLASVCVQAEDRGLKNACSNATLTGDYGFTISGTRPLGPPPAPIEQFVGLAVTHFDGNGGLIQPAGSSHGSISGDSPTDTGFGSYSLNADCTGTMTLTLNGRTPAVSIRIWMVVVGGGNEVHLVVMTPTPNGTPYPPANLTVSNGKKISLPELKH